MITEILPTLEIHKLTQEQYNRELEAGRINEHAIYLTPSTTQSIPTLEPGTDLNTVFTLGEYYLTGDGYINAPLEGIVGILRVTPAPTGGSGVDQIIETASFKFERGNWMGGELGWSEWYNAKIGGHEGLLVIPVDDGYTVMQWGRISCNIMGNATSGTQVDLPYAYDDNNYTVFAHAHILYPGKFNCGYYNLNPGNFTVYTHSTQTSNVPNGTISWMTIGHMNTDPRLTLPS